MPTNLPPVNKSPTSMPSMIAGVEQARAEKLANIARLVGITLGNNVLASVEKVEPIDAQQREQLLKSTQDVLMQLQRAPLTAATRAQIQQLLEQQQLLQTPSLKLAQLLVNGRPLTVYTNQALVVGQPLPIQLTQGQRLVILAPEQWQQLIATKPDAALMRSMPAEFQTGPGHISSATSSNRSPDIQVNLNNHQLGSPKTPLQTLLDIQQPNKPESSPEQTVNLPRVRLVLAEALRSLLPHQDQTGQLFPALPQLQQLPVSQRQALLPQSLQQALKIAADQIRTVDQLSNPRLLQLALKNSGVFFEHKLAANLVAQTSPTPDAAKEQAPGPMNMQDAQILTNRLTTQDVKGALLYLLQQTRQTLASETATETTKQATHPGVYIAPSGTPDLKPVSTLPNLLQWLQQLPQQAPELNNKQLRTQLVMLLHQQILTSLARVQLQQIHPLNHQQVQADSSQPSQSWVFELPVRQGHDVHLLEVRLHQDWVEEDAGDREAETTEKKRQWSVNLSFNLPDAGPFHAQLQVIDDSISARFWAERNPTLAETRSKIDQLRQQLESEGIKVTQMQCMEGKPPDSRISINYSLVDVTT